MTRWLGAELPDPLHRALVSEPGAYEGLTFLLLSVRDDAWPHIALLSVGEIVALDRRRLRLALWPNSTTTHNITERNRATLAAVLDEASFIVRIEVRATGKLSTPLTGSLASFDAHIQEVGVDTAPYAVLESGVRFRLKDPDETHARWEAVRAELRRDAGGD